MPEGRAVAVATVTTSTGLADRTTCVGARAVQVAGSGSSADTDASATSAWCASVGLRDSSGAAVASNAGSTDGDGGVCR